MAEHPPRLSPASKSFFWEAAWSAYASLSNAAALSLLATESLQEDIWGRHADGALPLAVCVALGLQRGRIDVTNASLHLLQTILCQPNWARTFLQNQDGKHRANICQGLLRKVRFTF